MPRDQSGREEEISQDGIRKITQNILHTETIIISGGVRPQNHPRNIGGRKKQSNGDHRRRRDEHGACVLLLLLVGEGGDVVGGLLGAVAPAALGEGVAGEGRGEDGVEVDCDRPDSCAEDVVGVVGEQGAEVDVDDDGAEALGDEEDVGAEEEVGGEEEGEPPHEERRRRLAGGEPEEDRHHQREEECEHDQRGLPVPAVPLRVLAELAQLGAAEADGAAAEEVAGVALVLLPGRRRCDEARLLPQVGVLDLGGGDRGFGHGGGVRGEAARLGFCARGGTEDGDFFEGSFAAVSLRLHCPPPFQPAIGRNKCGWGLDFRLPPRASPENFIPVHSSSGNNGKK